MTPTPRRKWIGRSAISAAAIATIGLRMARPQWIPGDKVTLGLIGIAILPWLAATIEQAEFGGWKLKFRELKEELDEQQRLINNLVTYSVSASIFRHLCGLAVLTEYIYHDNETNRREFYFLRDNGFIQPQGKDEWLNFGSHLEGKNLVGVVELTPIGWDCVALRRSEIPVEDYKKDLLPGRLCRPRSRAPLPAL
jgi:hypothetical protein